MLQAVVDAKDAIKKLHLLPVRLRTRTMRRALTKGCTPIARELRRSIKKTQWSTGFLKKNITSRVGKLRGTRIRAVVGARNQRGPMGRNPQKYLHLLEGGTRPHQIRTRGKMLKLAGKVSKPSKGRGTWRQSISGFAKSVNHPGSKAQNVLLMAARIAGLQSSLIIAQTIQQTLPEDVRFS
jgi:hypothetical protein